MKPAALFSSHKQWGYILAVLFAVSFAMSCGKTVTPAPKPQQPPFEFLGAWGDKGEGPGKLDAPVAFAVDTLGKVYMADTGTSFVHKFESDGTPLLSFEDAHLRHASGIAVDSGGAIYIVDAALGEILIFFPDGTFLRAMHMPPQSHFSGPLGISVDDQGNLFVPEPAGAHIMKFNGRGQLVKSWRTARDSASVGEPLSAIATAVDGTIYVAHAKTGRVEKYSSDGTWITSWNTVGDAARSSNAITGIAVSRQFLFTASAATPRIQIWTLDGQPKLNDDLDGRLDGVNAPQITVTPSEELLVFDPTTPRVFRFRIHL